MNNLRPRSYIKSKLFEITKEFKFQQNLKQNLANMKKFLKKQYLQNHGLIHTKKYFTI